MQGWIEYMGRHGSQLEHHTALMGVDIEGSCATKRAFTTA